MTDAEQKRVLFDFLVTFLNGGSLRGEGFRLDIEGDDIFNAELGDLLVRDMRLLMVDTVEIHGKTIITEGHKRRVQAGDNELR